MRCPVSFEDTDSREDTLSGKNFTEIRLALVLPFSLRTFLVAVAESRASEVTPLYSLLQFLLIPVVHSTRFGRRCRMLLEKLLVLVISAKRRRQVVFRFDRDG